MIPLIVKVLISTQAYGPKVQTFPRTDKPITVVIPVFYKEF